MLSNVVLFVMMAIIGRNQSVLQNMAPDTLLNWGANYGPLTLNGEPWRILTYAFLHSNLWHLLVNTFGLVFIGPYVERYLGRWRFLATYLFAAVMGGLMSLTMLPIDKSVGASGAILGLCGAAVLAEKNVFFLDSADNDSKPVSWMVKLTVLTMFLVSDGIIALATPGVDMGAHLGGLLGGIIAGALFSNGVRLQEKGRLLETFGIAALLVLIFADYTVLTKHFDKAVLEAHRQYDTGIALVQEGRMKEALPFLDRALQGIESKSKPVILMKRSEINSTLGQEIVALQDIVKAENMAIANPLKNPEEQLALLLQIFERKGIILSQLGEYGEAARVFKDAIGIIPESFSVTERARAQLFNNLAWCLAATEHLDEAKETIDKSLELDKNAHAALDTRGVILILQKHPDLALADLNQAISLAKEEEEGASYFHRAIAYRLLGKKKEADADMSTAASRGYKPDPWERTKFSDDLTDLEARQVPAATSKPN